MFSVTRIVLICVEKPNWIEPTL